jgi:hypothetical protein
VPVGHDPAVFGSRHPAAAHVEAEEPMTASPGTTTTRGRGLFVALLIVVALVAVAIGAYLDWLWWHPTQGIVVTLVAIAAILLAGLLFLFRRSVTTRLAFIGLAIGAGLLLGQWTGPSREPLTVTTGTMTLTLGGPIQGVAAGPADCSTVASGAELQVTMDPNTRLEIEGVDPQEHPLVSSTFAFGDRWQPDEGSREDGLVVSIYMNAALVPADGSPTELWLDSVPSSTIELRQTGNDEIVGFSGLAVSSGEVAAILGTDGDVTGTLEWSCDG